MHESVVGHMTAECSVLESGIWLENWQDLYNLVYRSRCLLFILSLPIRIRKNVILTHLIYSILPCLITMWFSVFSKKLIQENWDMDMWWSREVSYSSSCYYHNDMVQLTSFIRGANWWPLGASPTLISSKFCTNFSKWDMILEK